MDLLGAFEIQPKEEKLRAGPTIRILGRELRLFLLLFECKTLSHLSFRGLCY